MNEYIYVIWTCTSQVNCTRSLSLVLQVGVMTRDHTAHCALHTALQTTSNRVSQFSQVTSQLQYLSANQTARTSPDSPKWPFFAPQVWSTATSHYVTLTLCSIKRSKKYDMCERGVCSVQLFQWSMANGKWHWWNCWFLDSWFVLNLLQESKGGDVLACASSNTSTKQIWIGPMLCCKSLIALQNSQFPCSSLAFGYNTKKNKKREPRNCACTGKAMWCCRQCCLLTIAYWLYT